MKKLTAKPMRRNRRAAYPTALEVQTRPHLLRRYVPSGWLSRAELAAAAGAFLASNLTGCSRPPSSSVVALAGMPAPVSFFSEEEARQIISAELADHGIKCDHTDLEIPSVVLTGLEYRFDQDWISGGKQRNAVPVSTPLNVDLFDPAHKIGIEFISEADYLPLGFDEYTRNDLPRFAESLSAEVRRNKPDLHFGAFYDPRMDPERKAFMSEEEAQKALRQQVKDFVDWLKGQGVI